MSKELQWYDNPNPYDELCDTEFGTLGIRVHMTGEYSVAVCDGPHEGEITKKDVGLDGWMILSRTAAAEVAKLWLEKMRQGKGKLA